MENLNKDHVMILGLLPELEQRYETGEQRLFYGLIQSALKEVKSHDVLFFDKKQNYNWFSSFSDEPFSFRWLLFHLLEDNKKDRINHIQTSLLEKIKEFKTPVTYYFDKAKLAPPDEFKLKIPKLLFFLNNFEEEKSTIKEIATIQDTKGLITFFITRQREDQILMELKCRDLYNPNFFSFSDPILRLGKAFGVELLVCNPASERTHNPFAILVSSDNFVLWGEKAPTKKELTTAIKKYL